MSALINGILSFLKFLGSVLSSIVWVVVSIPSFISSFTAAIANVPGFVRAYCILGLTVIAFFALIKLF